MLKRVYISSLKMIDYNIAVLVHIGFKLGNPTLGFSLAYCISTSVSFKQVKLMMYDQNVCTISTFQMHVVYQHHDPFLNHVCNFILSIMLMASE